MSWLLSIGWFLLIMPIFGFVGFSVWMILSIMKDDPNIKAFILILVAAWFVGLAILLLSYFTDFATLAGIA
ncbi:TPA: hypothetical protein DEA21_01710 [Candidatus Uhrbacteria bacterium]|nr:hypothetical protein [Candidatus Uhrbacteria bacterium]HCU31283.1 hypothetical protein [Candidatus Uhrbacteria bacterium]